MPSDDVTARSAHHEVVGAVVAHHAHGLDRNSTAKACQILS